VQEEQRIRVLERLELEARRRADQLAEADRRKDEFLAMLAHELRNPLAPIRTAIDLLGRVPPGTEQATRAQRVIGRQAEHMARLVDDLLDVSRVTRGQLRLQVVPLDLAEVTRMVADDYRPVFANAGVALALEVSVRRVPVEGDATRLGQVVGNLLSNSAKFTPRGGKAFVSVEAVGDRARLCVRDTGAGIDPAIRERLFQPFTQSDRTLARSSGGLGLGLSLVKGIIDLHGGTVQARSGGVGRGSELIVELPLSGDAPRAARTETARSPARPLRVLVVEDNEDAAETLRMFLELEGHAVEVAGDGDDALSKSATFVPDVVLCDIGLPGKDGYEVARAIRHEGRAAEAVLVAVTGYAGPEDVRRAAEAGFDHHVPKPADMDVVRDILASAAG
jgi:two-component system CheB/CheR fusion protein